LGICPVTETEMIEPSISLWRGLTTHVLSREEMLDADAAERLQRSVLTALAVGLGDGFSAGGGGPQDHAGSHAFVGAANLGAEAYRVFEDDARAMPARSTPQA
ncbi:MAG: hypothetical protein ACPGSK_01625, partial [Alphaproteobacteria bacterium]